MKRPLVFSGMLVVLGTACASVGVETSRRFDERLYARAHEPELAKLDRALLACAGDEGPITVTWQIKGDGRIEGVVVTGPQELSARLEACVRSHAYAAQFAAPASRQHVAITRNVGRKLAAAF